MDMHVAAIIAAGGRGVRLGRDEPKQFLDLGDGTIMLGRTLEAVARCALVDEVVVALPSGWLAGREQDTAPFPRPLTYVSGGARRQDSVAHALAKVSDAADIVVIHDAARPFVTPNLIGRTIKAAQEYGAAIAAIQVTDTVKQAAAVSADGSRIIRATLPRETIFLAQTPQAFRRDILEQALQGSDDINVTDEAMLVERAGFPVHIVEGEATNLKVTTKADFAEARARVSGAAPMTSMRIGTGYDLHRVVPERPLILAGVHIPCDFGLHGHSDADIVCHAVTDAVLGAAALGDIGRMFPDSDAKWKDADSVVLLRSAMGLVHGAGYMVANVDVTVIAERPKLLPFLDAMRANLATALGTRPANVSIKGKTNEQVGEIGRGEAMACHAVALIVRT